MNRCPYCARQMAAMALREHVAVNTCGNVPTGACVAFSPGEAKATTEDEYRAMAERVARGLGWLVNHVQRGRGRDGRWMTPCAPGFPDNLFVHPDGALLVVEFKRRRGKSGTTPELQAKQQAWLEALANVPGTLVVRSSPLDWPYLQHHLAR